MASFEYPQSTTTVQAYCLGRRCLRRDERRKPVAWISGTIGRFWRESGLVMVTSNAPVLLIGRVMKLPAIPVHQKAKSPTSIMK